MAASKLRLYGFLVSVIVIVLIALLRLVIFLRLHSSNAILFKTKNSATQKLEYSSPFPSLSSLPHESLDLENGSQKESCRAGKISPNSRCAKRLQAGKPCKWYEEVGSFLRQEDKDVTWFHRRALRPCKSRPKLVMNEFPPPVCTKQSYLKSTNVLLCDTWKHEDRTLDSAQRLWYQQVGVWEVFRQSFYNSKNHRVENGRLLCSKGQPRMHVLEYGSGVAPFSDFLLTHCPQVVGGITIVDIAAEHFYFALWRLRYKLDILVDNGASLSGIEISSFDVNLPENSFDLIVIVTVFEHLPNPLTTAKRVLMALSHSGPGMVYEDYCASEIDEGEDANVVHADVSDPNLGVARMERRATLELFQRTCTLLTGDMGECNKRLWKCN
ncbi:hypothetical protein RI054_16g75110 [Pseudoscourfieldia marina]